MTAGIHDKRVRRHPHVFGTTDRDPGDAEDAATVLTNWDAIKRAEKGRTSVFDGIAGSLPSLSYADQVQRKAATVGFDWPDDDGALPKIAEEADELRAAIAAFDDAHDDGAADAARREVADELGDLLFAVVNVARHLGVDPEATLRAASQKFRTRFEEVERLARERGIDLHATDLATLDLLWDEVKARAV